MKNRFLQALFVTLSFLGALHLSAADEGFPKFVEQDGTATLDIYQVYFNMKNYGLAKEGKNVYLTTPEEKYGQTDVVTMSEAPSGRSTVWRLNLNENKKFSLMSLVGFYFNVNSESQEIELQCDPSRTVPMQLDILADGAVTLLSDKGYLTLEPKDETYQVGWSTELSDMCKWNLERAYDHIFDLPAHSTADNKVSYTVRQPGTEYYMTGDQSRWCVDAKKSADDSYWHFIYNFDGSGRMKIRSTKTDHALNYTGNYVYYAWNESDRWNFYVCDPEYPGLFLTGETALQSRYTNTNLGVACARKKENPSYWVRPSQCFGSTEKWFGELASVNECCWVLTKVESVAMAELAAAKDTALETLVSYKEATPFCGNMIDTAIEAVKAIDLDTYADINEAKVAIKGIADEFLKNYPDALVSEAAGKSVNLLNVRRSTHANKDTDGWFLVGIDNEGKIKLNTKTAGRDGGLWAFESDDNGKLRIRNKNGFYLGPVTKDEDVTTVTEASEAGSYTFAPVDGKIAIYDGTGCGLNLDTNKSDLVGYTHTDGGSRWTMLLAPIVPDYANAPELTTDPENKKLYLIRRASNPDDLLLGEGERVLLEWGSLQRDALWYFTPDPNNDGVIVNNLAHENNIYCINGVLGNSMNYLTTFYILPFDETEEVPTKFILSTTAPASDRSVVHLNLNRNNCFVGAPGNMEETALVFEASEGVNDEDVFAINRTATAGLLKKMRDSSPWSKSILTTAIEKVENSAMTDWADNIDGAVYALSSYVGGVTKEAEENIELEADNAKVYIINERREAGDQAPYLAVTENGLNTTNDKTAAEWHLIYSSNGRFYIFNGQKYVGVPSEEIPLVEDKKDAGMFRIAYQRGAMALTWHQDATKALNLDTAGSNLGLFDRDDDGSMWRIEDVPVPQGIDVIGPDQSLSAEVEIFNLQGVRLTSDKLAPGIYLVRKGNVTTKVIVK